METEGSAAAGREMLFEGRLVTQVSVGREGGAATGGWDEIIPGHRTTVPHEIKPTHSFLLTRQPAWKLWKDVNVDLKILFRPPLPSLHVHHVQGVFQQPELHLVILSATGQVGRRGVHLQKPPARGEGG